MFSMPDFYGGDKMLGGSFGWQEILSLIAKNIYYMALSHKDWELPNSQIWLAEIDIDHSLDFPI